jgi:hypothetical protein
MSHPDSLGKSPRIQTTYLVRAQKLMEARGPRGIFYGKRRLFLVMKIFLALTFKPSAIVYFTLYLCANRLNLDKKNNVAYIFVKHRTYSERDPSATCCRSRDHPQKTNLLNLGTYTCPSVHHTRHLLLLSHLN